MTAFTRRTALLGAAAVALGRPALAQGPMRWRFAHPHPESDSWQKAALRFVEAGGTLLDTAAGYGDGAS